VSSYFPGHVIHREYGLDKYDQVQEAKYQAYSTAYYSKYNETPLMPMPGFNYNPGLFAIWKQKFLDNQVAEAKSRGRGIARPLEEDDYTEDTWIWLYQRMLEASKM
jgi:hypothetical protein